MYQHASTKQSKQRDISMRLHQTLIKRVTVCLLAGVAFALSAGTARAQTVFTNLDWILDRGNTGLYGPVTRPNAAAQNAGHGDLASTNSHPGPAVPLAVWPFTRDLTNLRDPSLPTRVIIDNFNAAVAPSAFRTNPVTDITVTPKVYPVPGQSRFNGTWTVPPATNRTPFGGFSFSTDPSDATNFDYGYAFATHNDFSILRNNGSLTPATRDELATLPNASPNIYKVVHNVLANVAAPTAQWSSGQLLGPGRYAVEMYSPGDGTLLDSGGNLFAHPNVTRALVRVSWVNTVNFSNPADPFSQTINQSGVNDVINSRIFLVDLSRQGWIRLESGGLGPAAFSYDGSTANQLVVTLYTVTPDALNSPLFVSSPLVTADAVRFIPTNLPTQPGLALADSEAGVIGAEGRILASALSTNKFGVAGRQPFYYVSREESLPDPTVRSFSDPTDSTSTKIADPSAQVTLPIFYCIDGRKGNVTQTGIGTTDPQNVDTFITSAQKVVWRYVPSTGVRFGNHEIFSVPVNGVGGFNVTNNSAEDTASNPTHRRIVFASKRSGAWQIYSMNPDGTSVRRITNNAANDTEPRVSQDGQRIVFVSDRDGDPEIYAMDYDGANLVRLTTNAAQDTHPVWSPNKARIVFTSNRSGNNEIYVMNANGTNVVKLTNDGANDSQPTWSPDNTRIAYVSTKDGNDEIYLMNIDGTNVTRLTNNATSETEPAFSPTGAQIAYTSNRDGHKSIYAQPTNGTGVEARIRVPDTAATANANDHTPVYGFDGSTLNFVSDRSGKEDIWRMNISGRVFAILPQLTDTADGNASPSWTPLNARVAFVSDRDGNKEIYTINQNGGTPTRVTTNGGEDRDPSWMSGAGRIVFSTSRDGNFEIYSMLFNGTGLTRLTNTSAFAFNSNIEPAWSYDGTKVLFASNRVGNKFHIFVMNADGSGVTQLTSAAGNQNHPTWSPDGTKFAYASDQDGKSQIYTANSDGTSPTRISTTFNDTDPNWGIVARLEGSSLVYPIAFSSDRDGTREIYTENPSGAVVARLTVSAADDTQPSWAPDGNVVYWTTQSRIVAPMPSTSSASALMANVRCRDNTTRSMVFFALSSGDGSLGRIYALNPAGINNRQHTTAFWTYPSVRPLLNPGTIEPTNAPLEYNDPNYLHAAGLPFGTGYPSATTWGTDQGASQGGAIYYDGDIIKNPTNPAQAIVRADTRLPSFAGIQAAPTIVDDPARPNGPQLLLIPNMNGRTYAFEAGGRGDFTGDGFVAGTTQRIWTWPHLGVDAFRHLPQATQNNVVNNLPNEPSKVAFASTAAYQGGISPFLIGAGDGHLYSVATSRDKLNLPIFNNTPNWTERVQWLYPSADNTLGAPLSTVALGSPDGTNTFAYFTSGGRVYSTKTAQPAGTIPTTQSLAWVYPNTPNPPQAADPAVDPTGLTVALDPGFNGSAPLLMPVTGSLNVFALQSEGTLHSLDAGTGALLAKGQANFRSGTHTSPTGTILSPPGSGPDQKAVVVSDDFGTIQALAAVPQTVNGQQVLVPIWGYLDSQSERVAPAIIGGNTSPAGRTNGVIAEGDYGGQMRFYGFGDGATGTTPTTGVGEPTVIPINGGAGDGTVTVDLRLVDIYAPSDYQRMMLTPTDSLFPSRKTPGLKPGGANFTNTVSPVAGNMGVGNSLSYEWGDSIYVAAWGVYKALTTDATASVHGIGAPRVRVTFVLSGQNAPVGADGTRVITVPAILRNAAVGLRADDSALTDAEADALSIFGLDPNDSMNPGPKALIGTTNNVYPWVAVIRVPRAGFSLIPGARTPYTPNTAPMTVAAFAQIDQTYRSGMLTASAQDISQTLMAGQRDLVGKSTSLQQTPLATLLAGPAARNLYIAHPIGVSVRGQVAFSNVQRESAIGYSTLPYAETLGNGNRVVTDPASNALTLKSLFMPLGMVPPGSTKTYSAVDNLGANIPGLFVVDRSNYSYATGKRLGLKSFTRSIRWASGPSSVLNPLPWETMPNIAQDSPDYPHISPEAITLKKTDGTSIVEASDDDAPPLESPTYLDQADPTSRVLHETQIDLAMSVPQFQPANMNFGQLSNFEGKNFGFGYRDISGRVRGGSGLTDPIVGPILQSSGQHVNANSNLVYPAGGYITEVILKAAVAGQRVAPFSASQYFEDTRNATIAGTVAVAGAYRALEVGLTVPPSYRMRIAESTLDFGKLPHGAGYSDLLNDGTFRAPFAPTNSPIWPYTGSGTGSPWEEFFLPVTIINESNVNLFRPRIARLLGTEGATVSPLSLTNNPPIGVAKASRLSSDTVEPLANLSIFGVGFPGFGVGNIGIVSSLDHSSKLDNLLRVQSLWPLQNSYVSGSGISSAGLPTTNDLPNGIIGWSGGFQPHPTAHKPRVGDSAGQAMTVPDAPYGATDPQDSLLNPLTGTFMSANDSARRPKIGVAVPVGTPSGTYSNPIYAYEDYTPIQWRAWLTLSQGSAPLTRIADGDGILNINNSGAPLEPFTDPAVNIKVTVTESRVTQGATKGSLGQLDSIFSVTQPNPLLGSAVTGNVQPAVLRFPSTNPSQEGIGLYFSANRKQDGSQPGSASPWSLVYSFLKTPAGDTSFFRTGSGTKTTDAKWWSQPTLYPDPVGANAATYFPSTYAESQAAGGSGPLPPYLPGVRALNTERHDSPTAALAVNPNDAFDRSAFLVWSGSIQKVTGGNQTTQVTDSRIFYAPLVDGIPGAPLSFLNDPSLPKLSPRPLYLKLPASGGSAAKNLLFLFWSAGRSGQTSLYYNANLSDAGSNFSPTNWSRDRKLVVPNGLVWQSDPYAVYRRVPDFTQGGAVVDAIDIAFTALLKNRSTVEIVVSRYKLNRTNGTLDLMTLPLVVQETLSRVGTSNTYVSRDADWMHSNDPDGLIKIELLKNNTGTAITLNNRTGGTVQNGRYDTASGLLSFDSGLGGQIVVDPTAGTLTFPNVTPGANDVVLVTYLPRLMRMNVSRDDSNIVRTAGLGGFTGIDPVLRSRPGQTVVGNHYNPVLMFDRMPNIRANYTAPIVVRNANGTAYSGAVAPSVDRMWVLYRKTDPQGAVRSTIYYKAMRLMVRLPRPVALTAPDANGAQQLRSVLVSGNVGPYEVDWVRGRIYFTEVDEGRLITVRYNPASNGNIGGLSQALTYRITWGDEISTSAQTYADPANPQTPTLAFTVYETSPEVVMPSDTAVNEGQISAFKDPLQDKLWVFWSSTRGRTTDLFYQALAPSLYIGTNNQR